MDKSPFDEDNQKFDFVIPESGIGEAASKFSATAQRDEFIGGASTAAKERKCPPVKSFKTAQGSTYSYDTEGKTTRLKAATGELMDRQDLTVFVNLTPDEEQDILRAYHHPTEEDKDGHVYVVERQQDEKGKILRDVTEVEDPTRIYLAIVRDNKITFNKPVSLTPAIGSDVFDTRHYQENDQWHTERHLGNKVTEIEY